MIFVLNKKRYKLIVDCLEDCINSFFLIFISILSVIALIILAALTAIDVVRCTIRKNGVRERLGIQDRAFNATVMDMQQVATTTKVLIRRT